MITHWAYEKKKILLNPIGEAEIEVLYKLNSQGGNSQSGGHSKPELLHVEQRVWTLSGITIFKRFTLETSPQNI